VTNDPLAPASDVPDGPTERVTGTVDELDTTRSKRPILLLCIIAAIILCGGLLVVLLATRHTDATGATTTDSSVSTPKGEPTATTSGVGTTGAPTTGATVVPAGCISGPWPSQYQGQPRTLDDGKSSGYFVWLEGGNWHLRVLVTNVPITFTGRITSSGPLDPKRFKLIPDTAGLVTVDANVARFSFIGSPTAKGFDFSACGATSLEFALGTDTLPWPVDQIWTGKGGSPTDNPFKVSAGR